MSKIGDTCGLSNPISSAFRASRGPVALVALALVFSSDSLADYATASQRGKVVAGDVESFKITDVSGFATVRYWLDDRSNASASLETFEKRGTWQEEFFVMTRSFVYHPGFLNMNIGGGPLLQQQDYHTEIGNNSTGEVLYNANVELNILELKPYTFSLLYRRDNPAVTTSLSGRFMTKHTQYGARGRTEASLTRLPFRWEYFHDESAGSGSSNVVNEDVDRARLETSLEGEKLGFYTVSYDLNDRTSLSGSPGLPLRQTGNRVSSLNISGKTDLGFGQEAELRQFLRLRRYDFLAGAATTEDSISYQATTRVTHGTATRSGYTYGYSGRNRDGENIEGEKASSHNVSATLFHGLNDNLSLSGAARGRRQEDVGFSQSILGASGTASFRLPVSFGEVGLYTSLGLDAVDQQATRESLPVFDELLVLAGTNPSALANAFVDEDSVVVWNEPKTQSYIEGIDYRLVTIGETTSVQRLVSGNIQDGETVRVDYQYSVGGTAEYTAFRPSVSLTASLLDYLNLYASYDLTEYNVSTAESTLPLNPSNSVNLRADFSKTFARWVTAGAEAQYIDLDEEISPRVRRRLTGFLRLELQGNTQLSLSAGWTGEDIENSTEDVDGKTVEAGIRTRLRNGLQLAYRAVYLEDTGGTLPRRDRRHLLAADWAYRELSIHFQANYTDVAQGSSRSDSLSVTGMIYRSF